MKSELPKSVKKFDRERTEEVVYIFQNVMTQVAEESHMFKICIFLNHVKNTKNNPRHW